MLIMFIYGMLIIILLIVTRQMGLILHLVIFWNFKRTVGRGRQLQLWQAVCLGCGVTFGISPRCCVSTTVLFIQQRMYSMVLVYFQFIHFASSSFSSTSLLFFPLVDFLSCFTSSDRNNFPAQPGCFYPSQVDVTIRGLQASEWLVVSSLSSCEVLQRPYQMGPSFGQVAAFTPGCHRKQMFALLSHNIKIIIYIILLLFFV